MFDISLNVADYPVYRQDGWVAPQDSAAPFLVLSLVFSIIVFAFEHYLDIRQLNNYCYVKKLPKELENNELITTEKFEKSLAYGQDKFRFGLVQSFVMFVEGVALVLLGYLPFAWDYASLYATKFGIISDQSNPLFTEIVVTILFVVLLSLHDMIVSLPFSLYSTFVVEQRHGFNNSTLGLFFADKLKTVGLMMVIGSPILAGVIWLVKVSGEHFYFYVWAFLCIISIFLMTVFPVYIAPIFNQYTKLDSGEVYAAVEELAVKVSFPLTQIFLVDGSKRSAHSNAYFYGFFKNKRIVLYDTLINQVTIPELKAILGHEMGHWKLWHTAQGFLISQSYTFCLFLCFSYANGSSDMYSSFGFKCESASAMPVLIGLVLFTQTVWAPVDKALQFLLNANSRRNEFQADAFSNDMGMGEALGSGLVKISVENLGNMVPDAWYSMYHFSHPPLVERLRAIASGGPKRKKNE